MTDSHLGTGKTEKVEGSVSLNGKFQGSLVANQEEFSRKETGEDYLDWSKYRRFWSQVNQMSENTCKCAEQWKKELDKIAKENAKQGILPKEFPYPSDEVIVEKIEQLFDKSMKERERWIANIAELMPFDADQEQELLDLIPLEHRGRIQNALSASFPTSVQHIKDVLQDEEDKSIALPAINSVLEKVAATIKEKVEELLKQLQGYGEKLRKVISETGEEKMRRLITEPLAETEKEKVKRARQVDMEKQARNLGSAVRETMERDNTDKIVDIIWQECEEMRKHSATSPVIVLVGGGGAAGKTTFTKKLSRYLKARAEEKGIKEFSVKKLDLDNYFLPIELIGNRASDGKYDNPRNSDLVRARANIKWLRDGGPEQTIPEHDRKEHKLSQQRFKYGNEFRGATVLIVEGLYTLCPILQDLGHVKIYIDASPLDRAKGRVWRDINVRKRNERHVTEMLLGREQYHQTFVEPTQSIAMFIVRRSATGGTLGVIYEDELIESFRKACEIHGVTEKAEQLLREYIKLQQEMNKKRARQTEF